jgi:geranylgeranyl diphosphate synthase type II
MDARAYLLERRPLLERALAASVPEQAVEPTALHAAMRHLLFPGGKRLRPTLALAAAEALGAPPQAALPLAVAVELVHTYSLVHDDLPCMDDDSERRGLPTVHVAFGEAVAVLAGDALLAGAFEALLCDADAARASARLGAARDLAQAAGSLALVGGQVDDLAFPPDETDVARIESVHARKSAALITAAIAGGARLGGADAETIERLRRFGLAVGVAFQIADDLLDAEADEACSLARVLGTEGARQRADQLLDSALAEIEELGERAEPLRALARYAVRRSE